MTRSACLAGFVAVCSLSLSLIGCGEGAAPEDKVAQSTADEITKLGAAAKTAGGNFDSLSQADKDKFLQRVGGNEQAAKDMVSRMANGGGPRGPGSK
jgi:hypothetical protein